MWMKSCQCAAGSHCLQLRPGFKTILIRTNQWGSNLVMQSRQLWNLSHSYFVHCLNADDAQFPPGFLKFSYHNHHQDKLWGKVAGGALQLSWLLRSDQAVTGGSLFFSERQAAAWTHRQLLESDGSDGPKIQVSLATLGPWVRRVRALWQTRPCTAPFSSAQRIVDMSAFDSKGFPSVSSFLHSENRACVS